MSGERLIVLALGASAVASGGLIVIYFLGGQPQVEGILLAPALGGLGVAIVAWGAVLIDAPDEVEERHPYSSGERVRSEVRDSLGRAAITRRRFMARLLAGAVAALAAALALPALSLGPMPGGALFRTEWRGGARVVDEDGNPLRPSDLPLDSVRTVFPDGHVGAPDAQTLVIKVRPTDLALPAGRDEWTPEGCVAYSKICTHAGCPVGLYRAEDHSLLCPCHQSTFDVLRGAVPTFGPAARPLPQLPLEVDAEGYLVASSDFPEPVGPSFWNRTHTDDDGEGVR
jgi:ubiquinol-cytochrome c reductase iron-sulfur subunit